MALHPNFIGPVNRLQKISTNLRAIDASTNRAIMRDQDVYHKLGDGAKEFFQGVIDDETRGLRWGKGKQTDYGKVHYRAKPGTSSVKLTWEGENIAFVEYGAGIDAYNDAGMLTYPGGATVDYEPIREGRYARSGKRWDKNTGGNFTGKTDKAWYFKTPDGSPGNLGPEATENYNVVTWGWKPIAPFYKASQLWRASNVRMLKLTGYERAVTEALRRNVRTIWRGDNVLK